MNANHNLMKEVEQLNRQCMESYVTRDTAFLEQYLADDYASTFPDGTVLDKKGEIESLKSGDIALTEMTPSGMDVRTYGGATAVITGRSTIKANVKGQEVSGEYRFTDVWIKQGDRWLAVASQVTRIAESQALKKHELHWTVT
jgi:ketosteroid isomerase-like protein